jgi:hypothetical protein
VTKESEIRYGNTEVHERVQVLRREACDRSGRFDCASISGRSVAVTFLLPDQALQYIEHDWVDRNILAKTALWLPNISEFIFGITRVADIQATFGEPGFHYACRQQQQISGGILNRPSFTGDL